uniref:Uncharacterized protein n=1 Tax=Cacopsylla melanoneura TaxID=428564 RepID=A0A8D8WRJ0_9HEMI
MNPYLFFLIIPVVVVPVVSDKIKIRWNDIDPYKDTKFNLQNLTNKQLCDGDRSGCEKGMHDAIVKFLNGSDVSADCEDYKDISTKVCYIRKKENIIMGKMRTVFEMQMWFDTNENKTKCRYAKHAYEFYSILFIPDVYPVRGSG